MAQQINENMIREAAYFLWEKAGRPDGSAEFFWMKACEQFFKPKKVAIKKPAPKATSVKKEAPKKVTPAKTVVKPAVAKAVKTTPKVVAKPAAKKKAVKVSAPVFYGARK